MTVAQLEIHPDVVCGETSHATPRAIVVYPRKGSRCSIVRQVNESCVTSCESRVTHDS